MSTSINRAAAILSLIPRRPRSITVRTLVGKLRDAGHVAHHRSVQRDLVVLARSLPLLVDRKSKPYRWGWSAVVSCPWVAQ
jgi:hypothetical protein